MSILPPLPHARRSWRQRRDVPRSRSARRATLAAEHLEARQLLAINFTGNVPVDFDPATNPGVVIARPDPNDPRYSIPQIEAPIRDLVLVSGFQLDAIRLFYSAETDTLQIGIEQPLNGKTGQVVVAGDADNNGNGGTVDPAVRERLDDPDNYIDFPALGGTETMLVFIDLDPAANNGPEIVAGIDAIRDDPNTIKTFQVARFNSGADPNNPGVGRVSPFGQFLPAHTGSSFLGLTPEAPSFQFNINRFSELYRNETGRDLEFPLQMAVGGFAGSANDGGTSEAFIPAIPVTVPLVPPKECPPQSPQILINPHSRQHINTFHNTRVRVYVFGTFGFNVAQIDPSTVRLGGAAPVFDRISAVNRDQFPDRLFVFNGQDLDLPRGPQDAVLTAFLFDGTPVIAAARVYNQPGFSTPPSNRYGPTPLKPLAGPAGAGVNRLDAPRRGGPQAAAVNGNANGNGNGQNQAQSIRLERLQAQRARVAQIRAERVGGQAL